MEHYRCFTTHIWKTKAKRITDTLEWFPHYVKMPKISDLDLLLSATNDILKVLSNPQQNGPISPMVDSDREKLKTVTEILHKQLSQSDHQESPTAPSAPVLRVPIKSTATPATRVPEKTAPVAFQRVQNTPAPAMVTQDETPPDIPTQEAAAPPPTATETNSPPADELYTFDKVVNHKEAPKGCGSKYQVEVQWDQYPPSYVPVNIFTEHGQNTEAWEAVKEYVQQKNLHNVSGFKQFSQAHFVTNKNEKTIHINNKSKAFFQQCYLLQQQANKAINPDTGKLAEYSTLLKSSDGEHWQESCCQEIGRLAAGYPPEIPTGTETMHFIRFDQIPEGKKATYLRLVVADSVGIS